MKRNRPIMVGADAILLLVAAIWGGGMVAGKLALEGFPPLEIVAVRFCGSALVFGLLFWRRIRKCDRRLVCTGCLIGCVQFVALFIQLTALQDTTPAKQSFLVSTYVVFTPFIAWLISAKRPTVRDLLSAGVAMVGVGFLSLNGTLWIQMGDLLTLVFAVLFSLQIVLVEKLAHDMDSICLTFFQFAAAGLFSLVCVGITGISPVMATLPAVGGLAYLVLINTALAIWLQNYAQKRTKPSRAALLLSLESVFGFAFSLLVYRDPVTWKMLLGCALVLCATLISRGAGHGAQQTESPPIAT